MGDTLNIPRPLDGLFESEAVVDFFRGINKLEKF